jgi:hypothetical protein
VGFVGLLNTVVATLTKPPESAATAVALVSAGAPSPILLHPPAAPVTAAVRQFVATRHDWLDVPGADAQARRVFTVVLQSLGLTEQGLTAIAGGGPVQVTFPPDVSKEAVDFPWEFALTTVTRLLRHRMPTRSGRAFLVYRHLRPPDASDGFAVPAAPSSLLVVQSAPGPLAEEYEFESERHLVEAALDFPAQEPLMNPSLNELALRAGQIPNSVIHLSGVDAHQGRRLLATTAAVPPAELPAEAADHVDAETMGDAHEGMYLQEDGGPVVVSYSDLAAALTKGAPPRFVGFNLYYSAAGAMEAVRAGAAAAIGFQDEIEDLIAEQFFASFYAEWRRSDWDVLAGFRAAWASLTPYASRLRGTGVVVWSRYALIEATPTERLRRLSTSSTAAVSTRVNRAPEIAPSSVTDWADVLDVEYVPPAQLNYSLLHNDENIVPKLVIRRRRPGSYRSVAVQVTVSTGVQEAFYRTTLTIDDQTPKVDLHDKVRVPLTSELTRTLDESLFSTIYVAVKWGDHVLIEETHRVAFMPVDEWKYDDANARWLPSFVFPRDPQVRQVVSAAQRYLVALRDDATAGFDGYQSFEPNGDTLADRCRNVDAQVQAIWWSLVNEYALGYINPPPNYSDQAQRLRTPSEIVGAGRGTCIDLTLLLAACLEYIEIYPVVFLLNDHAFPGYWRSEASYQFLAQASHTAGPGGPEMAPASITDRDVHPDVWMLGRARFADLVSLVNQGHIVPLESVNLTARGGFNAAVADGIRNLRSRRQFHSMFDLLAARKKVTPIPIWSKRT